MSFWLWVVLNFGILPGTLTILIAGLLRWSPLTSDLSAWWASRALVMEGLTLALAIWNFRRALGGRKVLKGDFLDA